MIRIKLWVICCCLFRVRVCVCVYVICLLVSSALFCWSEKWVKFFSMEIIGRPVYWKSIIQTFSLKLVVEVGKLLKESFVWMNVSVHSDGTNSFSCWHFACDHKIGECTRGRAWHPHHAMNENFAFLYKKEEKKAFQ